MYAGLKTLIQYNPNDDKTVSSVMTFYNVIDTYFSFSHYSSCIWFRFIVASPLVAIENEINISLYFLRASGARIMMLLVAQPAKRRLSSEWKLSQSQPDWITSGKFTFPIRIFIWDCMSQFDGDVKVLSVLKHIPDIINEHREEREREKKCSPGYSCAMKFVKRKNK